MNAAIAEDLPHWPAELRDKWLTPEAERKGWPPSPYNRWRYAIGAHRDLNYLKNLKWRKVSTELKPNDLSPRSRLLVSDMFRGYYWRDPAVSDFSSFEGGRERFESLTKFLLEEGRYPWPPALESSESLSEK